MPPGPHYDRVNTNLALWAPLLHNYTYYLFYTRYGTRPPVNENFAKFLDKYFK